MSFCSEHKPPFGHSTKIENVPCERTKMIRSRRSLMRLEVACTCSPEQWTIYAESVLQTMLQDYAEFKCHCHAKCRPNVMRTLQYYDRNRDHTGWSGGERVYDHCPNWCVCATSDCTVHTQTKEMDDISGGRWNGVVISSTVPSTREHMHTKPFNRVPFYSSV